jgi:signal transduction histidine kinase
MEDVDLTMAEDCPLEHFIDPLSRLDTGRRILRQNRLSTERFGEVGGRTCHEAHFNRDEPCEGCLFQNVVDGGRAERWYLADHDEDGKPPSYYEISLIPIVDDDGKVTAVQEVIRDATATVAVEQHLIQLSENLGHQTHTLRKDLAELHKAQAALIQTEKLASLGKLAAGLTHEIHTPLGTLVANLDVLKHEIDRLKTELGDNPEALVRLGRMDELLELHDMATSRIQTIIRSLKHFAHLDRAVMETVDLHEGIESALNLLTYELKQRIEVDREYGAIPPVQCRPDAMNQVFMNLLQNAVQAIPDTGRIRIATRLKGDDRVVLEFEDDGKGIPSDRLDKIFDPGFTSKPRGVGSGLGLAIAQQTITGHGGTIEVRSKQGQGTCFTLELPLVQGSV